MAATLDLEIQHIHTGSSALSFSQERLWFLDELEVGHTPFNVYAAFRLLGPLDVSTLIFSLREILNRHHILRTAFSREDEITKPVLLPEDTEFIQVERVSHLDKEEQKALAFLFTVEETHHAFDLEKGPLFYAKLLRRAKDDHILVLNAHQTVMDYPSLNIFFKEFQALYSALIDLGESPLEDLPAQYEEFAAWQREYLQGNVLAEHLAYWKEQLEGASFVLELPADHPRPAVQSLRGGVHRVQFAGDWVDSLRMLAKQHNTSLDMVLLAAFNTLIHRYTGQTDFLTGLAVKNRCRPETQQMIGPLINTLVHRSQLSDTEPFTDLLKRTAEKNDTVCEHQEFPYEILVHEFQIERDLSRNALVQVMFEFDNPPPVKLELSGLKTERVDLKETSTHFDLSLCMYEDGNNLYGGFQYSADLFDAVTIERMASNFETLLRSIADNPAQKLFELPIMTEAERYQIVVGWNQSDKEVPVEKRVHELFEEHAARRPDRIAAAFQDQEVSYGELNKRANKLAHQLLERGIKAETVIGILADRSIDFLICILGIFKAGGAYVPIDPAYPPQRVQHMMTQSRAAMILGERQYLPLAEEALEDQPKAKWPQLIAFEDILNLDADDGNPGIEVGPEQLAYVIFTSGSTGRPKGAMVEHRGMLNHIYAKMYDLDLTEDDVIAQNASQCFDISVWQFLEALVFGGKTQIYEDEIAHAPKYLLEKVEEHGVTILETVPSIMRTMVEAIADEPDRPRLQSLRWMIPTGEALPPSLAREWLKSYPRIPLLNAYGPTECSDDVTHYAIYEPPPLEVVNMPIGRPIANMHLYVLDTHLQPVPIGVMGEIYVGGIGVGQGYIYDQERTDKAFMGDPFLDDPAARFYKTGDVGRWLPNGNIEYLGRVDFQVKVRGLRIELSEIDVAIEKHPNVREVVTTVYKTPAGHQYLVSYLVATISPPPGVEELRSFLMERLPEYMVPPIYVFLDEMPLTSNGKINRKALPAPEVARLSEDAYIAPRNAVETQMTAIWSAALGIEKIGVRDNFFDLGGHSLLAVRLFARIEKEFGKRLPLATLYQAPTIEALAALVAQDKVSQEVWSPIVKINPRGSRNPFFCVGGNVIEVRNVSGHLGEDQPFYMLHWQGLNADQVMTAGVQDVAAAFIEEVRKIQPHGPYSLGGVFASGVVAIEMARQFHEAGEGVETLVIFNTLPSIQKSQSTGERTKSRIRNALRGGPKKIWKFVSWRLQNLDDIKPVLQKMLWKVSMKFFTAIDRPLPFFLRTGLYEEFLVERATNTYKPPTRYPGNISVFTTADLYQVLVKYPKGGWSDAISGEVEINEIPGDACTFLLEPNVSELSEKLKRRMVSMKHLAAEN